MARTKTRADQFADLEDKAPRDFDPEDNPDEFGDDDTSAADSDDDTDAHAGRSHYAAVDQSKLRKKDVAPLGPQYTGSRISRKALDEDEDEHDPFAEYNSDDGSEDVEDGVDGAKEDDDDEDMASGLDGAGADTEDTSMSEDGDSDDMDGDNDLEDDEEPTADAQVDREQLRKMIHSERSNVAATIAQANKADADKGRAVKRQRQTFDSLLNSRIRLQQGLIAVNTIAAVEAESKDPTTDDATVALLAAETAATKLFNNLTSLRASLSAARGAKRAFSDISTSTPTSEIIQHMTSLETPALAYRRSILSKWSSKTSAASAAPSRGKLNNTKPATLIDVLGSHLADPARLVARTHIPRSCAPVQANSGVTSSTSIYDDADFYGLLLKELLEQRSLDTAAISVDVSASALAKQHAQAAREAKTKRNVDTKASKGRKLRYTVHEPLQNFMASEERGRWTERMREELFAGLLGRKGGLEEVDVEGREDGGEEEALMLFRS